MKKIRTRNQQKRLLSKLKQEQLINSYVKEQRERVDSEEHLGVKKPKPTSFLLTVLSFPFIVLLHQFIYSALYDIPFLYIPTFHWYKNNYYNSYYLYLSLANHFQQFLLQLRYKAYFLLIHHLLA